MIVDGAGRSIGYLRLSLTDACQMRCVYCRPETHQSCTPALTVAHYTQLVQYLVKTHGLKKIRLTGGDPSMRQDLTELIATLAHIQGIEEVCLTTHALTLLRDVQQWKDAGLSRVNISLDSLDAERFHALTGIRGLGRVLDGIHKAKAIGLSPKINTVVVRGVNDQELPHLAYFAASHDIVLRMIELMPMGPLASQWHQRYAPEAHMREILWQGGAVLGEDLPQGSSAARRCNILFEDGMRGEIGFITPMSCDFCAACNRLRIGSNGDIYPCLMDVPRGNLKSAFAPGANTPHVLQQLLQRAYDDKQDVHPAFGHGVMTQIGG